MGLPPRGLDAIGPAPRLQIGFAGIFMREQVVELSGGKLVNRLGGHPLAGAKANTKLTFNPDHPDGTDHRPLPICETGPTVSRRKAASTLPQG